MTTFGEVLSDTEIPAGGGGAITGTWRFSTTTAKADPGSGRFRFDAAAYVSITEMYISDTTRGGVDATNVLGAISNGDKVYVQDQGDAGGFSVWTAGTVVDEGSYFTIPLTAVVNGDLLANNRDCVISFAL